MISHNGKYFVSPSLLIFVRPLRCKWISKFILSTILLTRKFVCLSSLRAFKTPSKPAWTTSLSSKSYIGSGFEFGRSLSWSSFAFVRSLTLQFANQSCFDFQFGFGRARLRGGSQYTFGQDKIQSATKKVHECTMARNQRGKSPAKFQVLSIPSGPLDSLALSTPVHNVVTLTIRTLTLISAGLCN